MLDKQLNGNIRVSDLYNKLQEIKENIKNERKFNK